MTRCRTKRLIQITLRARLVGTAAYSQRQHDFAEHVPALEALKSLFDVFQRQGIVDDGAHVTSRHLVHHVPHVCQSAAEAAEDAELLLEQRKEVHFCLKPGGRAAGDEPATAFQRKNAAWPSVGADVFEHHINALVFPSAAAFGFRTTGRDS